MKIAVLIDHGRVARWQLEALRAVSPGNEFVIFNCVNSAPRRRSARHAAYYALNLVTIRNRQTEAVEVPADLPIGRRVDFEAIVDGAWEKLPGSVLEQIAAEGAEVALKLGMGLLRVPEPAQLPVPILSYHHGDPRHFRGRPAGFYELMGGEPQMGQIVQILSDRLDAGAVVAFAETKVHAHSYRKTLTDSFLASPLLLRSAIERANSGRVLPIEPTGRNYRLPSNAKVAAFCIRMAASLLRRLLYGALWEKHWRIAQARIPPGAIALPHEASWQGFEAPRRYQFLADPFFEPGSGAILAEAMRSDGHGEIACLSGGAIERLPIEGGHLSYPATVEERGRTYLVPESCGWSATRLFELVDGGALDRGELDLPEKPRLIDPTPFVHEGQVYLFGNRVDEGEGVLRLWTAQSLAGRFAEHPQSPIRISPYGARMGGTPFVGDGQLYRAGQDLRRSYGDGLALFRIEQITPADYRESEFLELRFTSRRGPHTLNVQGGTALFDYYDERFSLLAGFRRLRRSRAASG